MEYYRLQLPNDRDMKMARPEDTEENMVSAPHCV